MKLLYCLYIQKSSAKPQLHKGPITKSKVMKWNELLDIFQALILPPLGEFEKNIRGLFCLLFYKRTNESKYILLLPEVDRFIEENFRKSHRSKLIDQ